MCNMSFCPSASSWKKTCPMGASGGGTIDAERKKRLAPRDPTTNRSRSEPIIANTTGDKKFLERIFKSLLSLPCHADVTTEVEGNFIEGVGAVGAAGAAISTMACDGGKAERFVAVFPSTVEGVFGSRRLGKSCGGIGVGRVFSPIEGFARLCCPGIAGSLEEILGKGCDTPRIDGIPLVGCLGVGGPCVAGTRKAPLVV